MSASGSSANLNSRCIAEIARDLQSKSVSSAELVEASIASIERDPSAFTLVARDRARQDAAASDAMRSSGRSRSMLEGIPVSVKDLFDVEGEVTVAGSLALRNAHAAMRDAPVVARLKRAGAIMVGRTHMSEFAFTGLGDNPHLPHCGNPHDRERVCGGSSSGAAASVGRGQVAMGLGTDTGGSVRIPSSFCGLTGFKPTQSRVPCDGAFVLSKTQDSIGPITRSVLSCTIADKILAGSTVALPAASSIRGLKFAVPQTYVLDSLDPHVARSLDVWARRMSEAGASVESVAFPHFACLPELFARGTIVNAEAHAHHSKLGLLARRDLYDPMVLARIDIGGRMSRAEIDHLFNERARLIELTREIAVGFDALMLPTTPISAPRFDDLTDPVSFGRFNALALRNTSLINFLDCCAISLPMPVTEGLPAGLMLVGQNLQDQKLLSDALAVERVLNS
ncbi:MAG: amidase [Micropepsaceae bacterium]